ncbi:hypothetical protein [Phenylobacterium sp.]|jgi:hypothetical protein|uniref:hypothetical protein n=1 Tax=Phenylobacterium sp. TaxID=1871053 RepID=UPI003782F14C
MRLTAMMAALALSVAAEGAQAQVQAPTRSTPIPPPGAARGCANDPAYRQMDYILGEWDVISAGNRHTAVVKLEKALDGCTIIQTWAADSGVGDGRGMFTYSKVLGAWHYYWATNAGATSYFRGKPDRPNSIYLVGEFPLPDGRHRTRHLIFTLVGENRLQETSWVSEDGGKTWAAEFDIFWNRRAR